MNHFFFWMFLIQFIVNIVSFFTSTNNYRWHKEAVKYHHAYYHPTTGEFTWKKDCIK